MASSRNSFWRCTIAQIVGTLLLPGVCSAGLSFDYQYIDDPTGGFASRGWLDPNSLFQQNIVAALDEWGREFDSNETIVVDVVSDFGLARAGGTFSFGRFLGTAPDGNAIWEPGPLTRILTGSNAGETSFGFDVQLSFNPSFVENNYWFDPQPELRVDPVQFNRGDFISVVMHEFGHGLGMAGNRSFNASNYGEINGGFMSLYDSLTYYGGNGDPLDPVGDPNPMFFSGAAAADVYGSDVQVTHVPQGAFLEGQNFYHLSTCLGVDGLDDTLMNGCAIPNGERLDLTEVDIAIFEDQGYPIFEPSPGDFNKDGSVDGLDLALWEENYGLISGATFGQGDADSDGSVTGLDLLVWQVNLDPPEQTLTHLTPEPSSVIMFGMGMCGILLRC